MSIRPGAKMPSPKSITRQSPGISYAARDLTSRMTPSSSSSKACSIRSSGVSSVAAVSAIMTRMCRTENTFYRKPRAEPLLRRTGTYQMTLNKPARVNSGKSGETIANAILDEAVRAAVKLLRRFDRFYFRCVGEWLSLVEHLVRDQGVGGSNPLSPTNYLNPVIELASFPFSSFPQLGSTWVD